MRKLVNKYYFSVEGQTEKWYLERLQDLINSCENAKTNVKFDCDVQKNPIKKAKSLVIKDKTEIWHLFDYESNEESHIKRFQDTLDALHSVPKKLHKQIIYKPGYSNFTFELWMILHKSNCKRMFSHREQYLDVINKVYHEKFNSLNSYKDKNNFYKCLEKINLQDVKDATARALEIMETNKTNGYKIQNFKGFSYYQENPSLTIHEIIGKILTDCGLM